MQWRNFAYAHDTNTKKGQMFWANYFNIEKAIYEMCRASNIYLPKAVYEKIKEAAKTDKQNEFILKNAFVAAQKERPLCQDTGQVIVFLNIGQEVYFTGGNLKNAINSAVSRCYKENYSQKFQHNI